MGEKEPSGSGTGSGEAFSFLLLISHGFQEGPAQSASESKIFQCHIEPVRQAVRVRQGLVSSERLHRMHQSHSCIYAEWECRQVQSAELRRKSNGAWLLPGPVLTIEWIQKGLL